MKKHAKLKPTSDSPWMVTQVPAQLEEMAGACNEIHRANRQVMFIVPISTAESSNFERPTSHIAIFSLPAE